MGLVYAYSSFVAIVALHRENGLTREEVEEFNKRTYRAKLEENWFAIDPERNGPLSCSKFIEVRDGKYFLKPDEKIDKVYLENILEKARINLLPANRRRKEGEKLLRKRQERLDTIPYNPEDVF